MSPGAADFPSPSHRLGAVEGRSRTAAWFQRLERARIRLHIRFVGRRIRRVDPPDLSLELRSARMRNLDRLHAYRKEGRFPRNTAGTDRRVPLFMDGEKTPCAVAYLMMQDGETSTVDDLSRADNHVRIRDVKDEGFFRWLGRSGITQEEAAAIQPAYQPEADLGIFMISLLLTFLPFRLVGELVFHSFGASGHAGRFPGRLLFPAAAVVASVAASIAAVFALSPSFDSSFAGTFRLSLFIGFLAILAPLAVSVDWLLRRVFPNPSWKRLAGSTALAGLSLGIAILFGPAATWALARAMQ